jgi:hypothetical protein
MKREKERRGVKGGKRRYELWRWMEWMGGINWGWKDVRCPSGKSAHTPTAVSGMKMEIYGEGVCDAKCPFLTSLSTQKALFSRRYARMLRGP